MSNGKRESLSLLETGAPFWNSGENTTSSRGHEKEPTSSSNFHNMKTRGGFVPRMEKNLTRRESYKGAMRRGKALNFPPSEGFNKSKEVHYLVVGGKERKSGKPWMILPRRRESTSQQWDYKGVLKCWSSRRWSPSKDDLNLIRNEGEFGHGSFEKERNPPVPNGSQERSEGRHQDLQNWSKDTNVRGLQYSQQQTMPNNRNWFPYET